MTVLSKLYVSVAKPYYDATVIYSRYRANCFLWCTRMVFLNLILNVQDENSFIVVNAALRSRFYVKRELRYPNRGRQKRFLS
jgi:hypothetical protein